METNHLENLIIQKDTKKLTKLLFNFDLTPKQEEIVRVISFAENNRIVLSCMTRYGKSRCVAIGVLLYILFHNHKTIILLAPTQNQTSIIRNYLTDMIVNSEYILSKLTLDVKGTEKLKKEISKERMTFKDGSEIRTLTAGGEGQGLMGFGGDLIICDEDCLINYEVFRSKISRMFGDNPDSIYISIGNPWHRNNQMWENWKNPKFKQIHIGWRDALKEGRITKEYLDEQKQRLTEREFQILYEAQFPEEQEDQLIKWEWIQRAYSKSPQETEGIKKLGVDVARMGGDYSVFTYGIISDEQTIALDIKHTEKQDTMNSVGMVLNFNEKYKLDIASIDTSGLGAGVTDRITELSKSNKVNFKVIPFMSGESPTKDKERYLNKKAEAYFYLRELFEKDKITIPRHTQLINELTKMRWELTSGGKVRILDPDKSPDFADSLCYFAFNPPLSKPQIKFG